MRLGWREIGVAGGAVLVRAGLLIAASIAVSMAGSAAPPGVPTCDEYNPFGPARSGEITLDSTDFADEHGTEMLSFIETESIGPVEAHLVSASPANIVRAVSAAPDISTASPYYGERLKGIRVAVSLNETSPGARGRPVRVVLKLRQVCAQHFRNTFLYY